MADPSLGRQDLRNRYQAIRQQTLQLCACVENEDLVVQPAPDVSPPKWHLGHTTWFFETVILTRYVNEYQPFNTHFSQLFNSYYKALGQHTAQAERGNLSRPTVKAVLAYRQYVDTQMDHLLSTPLPNNEIILLIETGLQHEQQHQELLYMDLKYILAVNEIEVKYSALALKNAPTPSVTWSNFDEGIYEIGHGGAGFSYDNEGPRHKTYLYPFAMCNTLVTNGDYLAFIEDGGYTQAKYWLSQGWDWVNQHHISQPLYWRKIANGWYEFSLHGLIPLDVHQPVVHISYFEASAFANWKQLRLPTEQEYEVFLANATTPTVVSQATYLHPNDATATTGQVWCWTMSQYNQYPRFKAFDGLLNEYNSKFMCNQFVLRGGCVVTPHGHFRNSYRNFYQPQQRWMFSGIRLAKDTP